MGRYEPTCEARVADGAVRGAFLGLLWSGFFLPSGGRTGGVAAGWPALRFALRTSTLTTAGFAVFLGGYNGVFCVSERTFGRTWLNPAVSGGMLGAAIGYGAHPSKVSVVAGAAATAALCTATDYAWGPAESRQRRGDRDGDV